jgi:prepilin-type N-terminal cleavage/methylation domain-containing protein
MGAHKDAASRSRGLVGSMCQLLGRRGGFTLIELLVVIGIIAVLAAIIIPVYARAQEKARQATCLSNLHGVVVAMKIYQADYRDFPPPYDPGTGYGGVSTLYTADYLSSVKVLRCPDDQTNLADYMTLYAGFAPTTEGGLAWDDPADNGRYYREHYSSYNCMPGVDPAVSGGAATVDYQLYNAFGYDIDGLSHLAVADATEADRRFAIGSAKFAGLVNRYAPDETIITHCPFHRDFFGRPTAYQDIVLRVGGDAALMKIVNYDWVNQPPE